MVTHNPKAAAFGTRTIHLEKGELTNRFACAVLVGAGELNKMML